ncbi:ectoine hydroxylase [Halomonas sp. MCCC 1A17488]|uniref:Ectoine hydroxylase n=1 Tax=Billgrantia sulfidoxydans TaxID=2733484 RepID=A0ABX7W8J2_9GAMM|nr:MULTISPECIES: ectoine hydroxylase [Halomonas]MCE8018332.1 ectoine hydroxylase [Halomonas sp. MCCC 1A17488]MCG3241665.1 ectoine hydroxylase [Halomonas sp. MCCC 1A17488]QPP49304.1 ectoine hydroxylase [Halomonas sp. SS10-MC5]QTP56661.1 ectoine hydroxylase [Halomonas sulfidoxydans]
MTVQTSSNRKLKQATDYAGSETLTSQVGSVLDRMCDAYPTRLAEPLDTLWLERREGVVRGRDEEGPLNQAQLDEFERKGFLFEPNFIRGEELDELRRELSELLNRDDFRGRDFSITEPGSREIRSLFAVHYLSERFASLARDERLVGRVRQILGGDAYVHQSRINYKPGFEGKGFNWHSDFETWHAEDGMPAMHAVSASIVLTDNHEFNGPLMLIPGSHRVFVPCLGETPDDHHRQSLKRQEFGVPGRDALRELVARHGIEAPKGTAGGLLLFDCNTLHGSNANMSPDPRSNVFFVYNRRDNACVEPFAARRRRPRFLAHSPDEPWTPHG